MSQSHLVYDAPAENSTKIPTTPGLGSYVTPGAESKPEAPPSLEVLWDLTKRTRQQQEELLGLVP